jgi:pimeloyl-ACP methyl ester carboxylesterase
VVARYELLRGRFGGVHDPWWIAEDTASMSYDSWRDPDYERALRAVVREFDFDFLTPALARSFGEPVLVIWGSDDPLVPVSTADRVLELLPQARLVAVRRSWHRPHVERPQVVTRMIVDFLLRVEQGSPAIRH